MQLAAPVRPPLGAGTFIGPALAVAMTVIAGLLVPVGSSAYEAVSAVVLGTVLIALSVPILARYAAHERDRRLLWLLVFALVLKLIGAVARHYVAFEVYERADATRYHEWGVILAERFREGNFATDLPSLTGTSFIRLFTGIVYTIIGPSTLSGFIFYSWLGFWGLFLFYRAFRLAVPEGRPVTYAHLLFFLPSLVFWPSSIGKEAWMMFALGVAVYGVATVLSGNTLRGLAIAGAGLWLAAIVRPHVAGMVGIALATGYLLRRPHVDLRQLAPIVKLVSLAAMAAIAVVLINQTEQFLETQGIDTRSGVTSVLEQTSERTGSGESEFAPSVLRSPARAPIAVGTVLFRPFVFEAHNAQTLAAAVETTFLLGLFLFRLPWLFAAIGSARRQPYVLFAATYVLLFAAAFSSAANFGFLARERVQVLPLFLLLLCIPPRRSEEHQPSFIRSQGPAR